MRGVRVVATLRSQSSLRLASKRLSSNAPPGNPPSVLKRLWEAYARAIDSRPLTTKTTAAALIFFVSDSATQYISRNKESTFSSQWDMSRALSGSAFGVVATSFLHYWWGALEAMVGPRIPVAQYRLANTLTKVIVDQGLAAPFYIYSYYVVTNFLQSLSAARGEKTPLDVLIEKHEKASEMLWPTMLRHWRLWPLVHTLNFYYVPLHHRVLVQNVVLIGWSGYLSHLNNGGLVTPKEEIRVTEEVLLDPSKEDESPGAILVRRLTSVGKP